MPLGQTLSTHETNLYEYSAYSLMEEIDINFCKFNNKQAFWAKTYTLDSLTDKVQFFLEMLEQ